ncbi:MAG: hypothetical protein U1C18_01665, partial [Patescibacteria group bacterium]|nr:hypothetical protein [Patescibacteria group bacterium]
MIIIPSNTSLLIACLCFVLSGFAVPASTAHSAEYAAKALNLWDGEATGGIYHYGKLSAAAGPLPSGSAHFAGAPDKWHEAGIGLNNLASWRADLREYGELRFYAKTTDPSVRASVRIYAWPHFSASVDIGPLSEGGSLSTEYRLVRVPFEMLATEKFSMDYIEIAYFGAENPPEGYGIYIDDMHAAGVARPAGGEN